MIQLFWTFFKIGLFTFGGGYAMIPMIQEQVQAHGWLDAQTLVDFIAVSESTPGPFAINMATFVGTRSAGLPGALCATLGVVLPSFLVILLVAKLLKAFRQSIVVSGVLSGLKPAVVGLVGAAFVSVALTVFFPAGVSMGVFTQARFYISALIFALSVLLAFQKLHPIWILCLSALLGLGAGYLGLF